ncbi:2OG-Fe(II) oxygenase [Cytophagaceae bacterium DM2B3-1]|uniref:2OG-Fe(II) oxygenase n=1 Tax=Xanthocytophaga flava TaxID=3048013 RepID=A0ABT7CEI5_9BACT|nr:2OG-Fe(II) oxygenase [Xanthocytophaga flavus]MDJ1491497.1 2OG-Fe(II) oxygenase [Xanthocytophaga flavus]
MELINPIYTDAAKVEQLAAEFQTSKPYKHLVLDNFFRQEVADKLYENFPSVEKLTKHWKGMNENKSEGSNFSDFDPIFTQVRNEIMSPEFAQWMEKVTGIKGVFVTDDSLGTGLHQGSDGSFLDIHVDFNIHHVKNVYRRLNFLVYLNKNWKEEYGGGMEMWNADMTKMEKVVMPILNRVLIFETSEISYHGYSKITLPPGETRKSFYTYFYTPITDPTLLNKYHDTIFKPKPGDSTLKKVGTNTKETLKNFIKGQLKRAGVKF